MSLLNYNIRWAFNVSSWKPTLEQWKLAVQCVQKEETDRCYKFAFIEDCKASMVGQLLMRKAAAECIGLSYNKIEFARTSAGKPYIVNNKGNSFFFNTSHNGDFCVLAAEKNFNVGIDVMKVEQRGNRSVEEFFSLMQKQFSSHEWDFLTQPGLEMEQLRRFFRLWCLKESYVKAIGTGIVVDLQSISFSCQTPMLRQSAITIDTKLYLNKELQPHWKFEESFLDIHHCVAVALEQNQQDVEKNFEDTDTLKIFKFLTFEELLKNCIPFERAEDNFWLDFLSKSEKKN